jgi:hypothetical protein
VWYLIIIYTFLFLFLFLSSFRFSIHWQVPTAMVESVSVGSIPVVAEVAPPVNC